MTSSHVSTSDVLGQAPPSQLVEHAPVRGADSLETVTLGLDAAILSRHVHQGRLNVNCTASVANAYWESRIESTAIHVAQKLAVLGSTDMRNGATGEHDGLCLIGLCFIYRRSKYIPTSH